jgi:hypothetical protein
MQSGRSYFEAIQRPSFVANLHNCKAGARGHKGSAGVLKAAKHNNGSKVFRHADLAGLLHPPLTHQNILRPQAHPIVLLGMHVLHSENDLLHNASCCCFSVRKKIPCRLPGHLSPALEWWTSLHGMPEVAIWCKFCDDTHAPAGAVHKWEDINEPQDIAVLQLTACTPQTLTCHILFMSSLVHAIICRLCSLTRLPMSRTLFKEHDDAPSAQACFQDQFAEEQIIP